MYKVFFKDRIIFFTQSIERDLSSDFDAIFKYSNAKELTDFVLQFERKEELKKAFIYHHDLKELFKIFQDCFKYIVAAGGWVQNNKGEVLFIHRLGVWDLPKGKLEKKEKIEDAAIREVEEECGITQLMLGSELSSTYHTYRMKGKLILKRTHWYRMAYSGSETLVPQTEEDITEARWIPENEIAQTVQNTYPSIIEVIQEAQRIN